MPTVTGYASADKLGPPLPVHEMSCATRGIFRNPGDGIENTGLDNTHLVSSEDPPPGSKGNIRSGFEHWSVPRSHNVHAECKCLGYQPRLWHASCISDRLRELRWLQNNREFCAPGIRLTIMGFYPVAHQFREQTANRVNGTQSSKLWFLKRLSATTIQIEDIFLSLSLPCTIL